MRGKDLYARILEIQLPWRVDDLKLRLEADEVQVRVSNDPAALRCPICGQEAPGYATRQRRWRHLDTCQDRTLVLAAEPRVQCTQHGVVQITIP